MLGDFQEKKDNCFDPPEDATGPSSNIPWTPFDMDRYIWPPQSTWIKPRLLIQKFYEECN